MVKTRSKREKLAEKFEKCGLDVYDAKRYVDNFERRIRKYLNAFRWWARRDDFLNIKNRYKGVARYSPQPKTQKEIQELIRAIEKVREIGYDRYIGPDNETGVYISYIVNKRYPGDRIELEVRYPFNYLGLYTNKDWIIKGDVGEGLGEDAKGGKIVVKGNAKDLVGACLEGGVIIIEGDVEGSAGLGMKSGEIIIKGNAGSEVGGGMRGGRIVVEGNAKDWVGGSMDGGEIIIKGDVGDWLGGDMTGGRIIVEGKAGKRIEDDMEGGEIFIGKLDPRNLSDDIYGGNIYAGLPGKAEPVVKDGKLVRKK